MVRCIMSDSGSIQGLVAIVLPFYAVLGVLGVTLNFQLLILLNSFAQVIQSNVKYIIYVIKKCNIKTLKCHFSYPLKITEVF